MGRALLEALRTACGGAQSECLAAGWTYGCGHGPRPGSGVLKSFGATSFGNNPPPLGQDKDVGALETQIAALKKKEDVMKQMLGYSAAGGQAGQPNGIDLSGATISDDGNVMNAVGKQIGVKMDDGSIQDLATNPIGKVDEGGSTVPLPPDVSEEAVTGSESNELGQPDAAPATIEDLIRALKGEAAGADTLTPSPIKLQPSVETIIREAGPTRLNFDVEELTRALSKLVQATDTHLTTERVALMTTEDVPEVMTPVAKALHDVLLSASAMRHKLNAIAEASNLLLGRAAARGAARLGIPEPADAVDEQATRSDPEEEQQMDDMLAGDDANASSQGGDITSTEEQSMGSLATGLACMGCPRRPWIQQSTTRAQRRIWGRPGAWRHTAAVAEFL